MFLKRTRDFALKGANAEVGFHLDHFKQAPLYFAAGPYYLTGVGKSTWGGELRARINLFSDYVGLEGNTAYDHFFKWTGQGQVSVNIPFGPKSKVFRKGSNSCSEAMALNLRAIQPVDRSEIIPVGKQKISSVAINPATNEPYFFIFVDNTSSSLGTFESPYASLAAAQSASLSRQIIYVFPGDLSSTGLSSGIILKDNQKLWGSPVAHSLNTTLGTVRIPSLTPSQLFYDTDPTIPLALSPVITNTTGSDVITVANNNEISGIYIQNLTGNGISASSVSGLTVTNCIFQGPDSGETSIYGISLSDVSGTVSIDSNLIYQGIAGINISASDITDATYSITNNDAPSIALLAESGYGNFLVASYTNCSNTQTIIEGNSFTVSQTPVQITFENTVSDTSANVVSISNNDFISDSDLTNTSCLITLNNYANVDLSMYDNEITNHYGDAVTIVQNNDSALNLIVNGNLYETWYSGLNITLNWTALE